MGYMKVISYGDYIETYEYEKNIEHNGRKTTKIKGTVGDQNLVKVNSNSNLSTEQRTQKRKDNAVRSTMVFRRLVKANLSKFDVPLFISLTYSENITDVGQGYQDFKTFIRNIQYKYKEISLRYIAVPEFQKSGRLHFHALLWGLPTVELARTERSTRLFAKCWGKGFVDLVATDGDEKISSYLAKYMQKSFVDSRLNNKKAYTCSRNIIRPIVDKNTMLMPYLLGSVTGFPDISKYEILQDKSYVTQWLGKGRYKLYKK